MNSTAHPLDPLSAQELKAVLSSARTAWGLDHRHLIAMVTIVEPSKEVLAHFKVGDVIDRAVQVTVWDRAQGVLYEGVLTVAGQVRSWVAIEGAKSPVLQSESELAIKATRSDSRVIAALKRRGIENPQEVHIETWPIGAQMPEYLDDDRRLIWTPIFHRPTPDSNLYAHPIAGLYAIVDIDKSEVVEVEESVIVPIPQTPGLYRRGQTIEDLPLKKLTITQPEGASFTVDGWKINWERWSFRIGFCQREGLVINELYFNDHGIPRKIAHRMSIAELVIPYGDPSQGSYRKNAFDTGEFGLGNFTNSLTLGCDCLGEILYFDAAVTESDGTIREIKNAICMHEEDFGILWKHVDIDGHTEVRRGRRLVVSSIVTVNNYEYGYFWYFYQDGAIEFEAKLTGIVLTLAAEPGQPHPSSTEIEPGLLAPFHQHILCARLDLDVDGENNSVVEVDAFAHPLGEKNPYGGAYEVQETVLHTEAIAQRIIDPFKSRFWKIINPTKKNHLGKAVGYKLVPGHQTFPLALRESALGKRAQFMYHHLWVTLNSPRERYPAGDYPFQHAGGAGLPEWTRANRTLENKDVVLWYVFGVNHIPRSEDWPVMPVERVGFHLKPSGFFRESPANTVAPVM